MPSFHHVLGRAVKGAYAQLQKNYFGFRTVVFLKESGIARKIAFFLDHKKVPASTTTKMSEAQSFLNDNAERIEEVLSLLADDLSRDSWWASMRYRAFRTPIPPELASPEDQYLPKGILKLNDGEIIVDAGAYIGDSLQMFYNHVHRNRISIAKSVAFEPDHPNMILLRKHMRGKNVVAIEKGLSDSKGTLSFVSDGATSKFTIRNTPLQRKVDTAPSEIPVTTIDSLDDCSDATMIKMDIEGSEQAALRGAKQTILRNRPKLAICIYHSNDDMIRIIEWVHNLVPEYRLFVRQHALSDRETVMYAIP